jgi:hypothetical protein
MNANAKLEIIEQQGDQDLYLHYPGQYQRQNVYLYLDCESGEAEIRYNPEIGTAIPMRQWNGLLRAWPVNQPLKARAANQLLEELSPLLQSVLDGFESVWDGSNLVGRFNESACQAHDEIEKVIEDFLFRIPDSDIWYVWEASDWLDSSDWRDHDIPVDVDDETVDQIATKIRTEAEEYDECDEITDLEEWIRWQSTVRAELEENC